MPLIWRKQSNELVRSYDYTPQLFEPSAVYSMDTCFNCGGSLLIERGSAELGHEKIRCPICDGVGETLVGIPPFNYIEWIALKVPNVVIFFVDDELINWTPP